LHLPKSSSLALGRRGQNEGQKERKEKPTWRESPLECHDCIHTHYFPSAKKQVPFQLTPFVQPSFYRWRKIECCATELQTPAQTNVIVTQVQL
jgi:hypothetical protein